VKFLLPAYRVVYALVSLFFAVAGLGLIGFAVTHLWHSLSSWQVAGCIEALGLLAISLVSLEISQTVTEEEVIRQAHVSAPTRVRRYLSRFLVVVVVALGVETLVAVTRTVQDNIADVPRAVTIGFAAAALLLAWGAFIWMNRSAEELEPEAMAEAKREDRKLK
jgi:hypothetical protein